MIIYYISQVDYANDIEKLFKQTGIDPAIVLKNDIMMLEIKLIKETLKGDGHDQEKYDVIFDFDVNKKQHVITCTHKKSEQPTYTWKS